MTFVVGMRLTADGKQAKAELTGVSKEADKVTASATKMGGKGKAAATDTKVLSGSAKIAKAEIAALARSEQIAAQTAVKMGGAHRMAGGSLANLTAQFNDIGVMMAAGQNPLQLALQQGTQITQVIGPMGTAGAVKALGSAFVQMLNPVSLITIGSIAAGAAMIQWMTSGGDNAELLVEQIDAMADAVDDFTDKSESARAPWAELVAEFGSASPEIRAVLKDLAALGKIDAYKAIDETAESLRKLVLGTAFGGERVSEAMDFLGLRGMRKSAQEAGVQFAQNLVLLDKSRDAAEKYKIALDLREQLLNASNGIEGLNATQREFYDGLAAIIRSSAALGVESAVDATAGWSKYYASRISGEQFLSSLRAQELQELAAIYGAYAATLLASDAENAKAAEILATLEQENTLRAAIFKHGENSVVVTELRLAAEAAVFEKKLATLDISQSQEASLRAAFEESQRLSQIDMASGISAAAAEAYKLAESLGIAVNEALSLLNIPTKAYSGRGGDPRNYGENGSGSAATYAANQNYVPIDEWIKRTNRKNARGSGGGSKDEQQSIDDLIASLQDELAILQEIDPVQQEMLRNREVLATATDQERAAVETLISQRVREQQQMEDLQETREFFSETIFDSMDALIFQGATIADVMSNVASMIAKAALQAALLGEGPLASLFGGSSSSGGFLGSIFKIFTQKLASGGPIYGPGSGTSDDVPIWASNGEFMMNAAATAKNRHLLEAMNSGWSPPGYAGGGAIGSSAPANFSMPGQSQTVEFNVYATGTGNSEIEASAKAGMEAALEEYDRNALPLRFDEISNDKWAVG